VSVVELSRRTERRRRQRGLNKAPETAPMQPAHGKKPHGSMQGEKTEIRSVPEMGESSQRKENLVPSRRKKKMEVKIQERDFAQTRVELSRHLLWWAGGWKGGQDLDAGTTHLYIHATPTEPSSR